MKHQWTRYVIVALFACFLGALAHASISRAMQGNGAAADGARAARPAAQRADDRGDDQKPQNTLLRKLWDLIDQARDLSSEEKSEAFEILEEADPILTRIKKENEKAIEILRNPPRMVVPKRPVEDDEDVEEAPAAEELPAPEEQDQDEETGA